MPELPEVETVRAGLERHVVGRTVADVQVLHPRVVRRDLAGPAGFAAAMAGRTVKRAERRGKYLWLALDDDEALLAHLGMSGQLLVGDPDRPLSPHVRARFTFTDGGADLRFTDQRTFGHLMLVPFAHADADGPAADARELPAPIAHIAPDPMEAAFDAGDFGARLHWARPTETLRRGEVSRLLDAVREVLSEALRAGGTSFDALYVDVNGESGYFDRSLQAYGREGEPCGRCGTPIRRDSFMNRSSYSCPHCQPRPRRAHL